jgi:hypothetical protein
LEEQLAQSEATVKGLRMDITNLTKQMDVVQMEHSAELRKLRAEVDENERIISAKDMEIESLQSQLQDRENGDESGQQLDSLSDELVTRQVQIESLQRDKSALQLSVEEWTKRARDGERQLQEERMRVRTPVRGGAALKREDLEMLEEGAPSPAKASSTRRRITGGHEYDDDDGWGGGQFVEESRFLTDLSQSGFVGEKMANAARAVDQVSLQAGAVMQQRPLVRIGVALYILMLHLWVFFILFSRSHGALEMQPQANELVSEMHTTGGNGHVNGNDAPPSEAPSSALTAPPFHDQGLATGPGSGDSSTPS